MPKVSIEHRSAQEKRVMQAAQRCFSKKGFHRTSMDDILEESGMSAGALYTYFDGKEQIIEGIATTAVEQLSKIAKLQKADLIKFSSFESVLNHLFNGVDQIIKGGYARIAVQAWGEAQTDVNIKKIAIKQIKIIRQDMSELARHCQEAGLVDANSAADEIGKVIFGFIPGYILQSLFFGDVSAENYAKIICGVL
jgi:AcrR family transcriptional regulator